MQSRHSTGLGELGAAGDTGGGGAYDVPSFLLAYHVSRGEPQSRMFARLIAAMRMKS